MRKIGKVTKDSTIDIICDICGKSTKDEWGNYEFAEIKACWGYLSRKDQQKHECHLCEDCYDEVVDFIKSKDGKINISEYYLTSALRSDQ